MSDAANPYAAPPSRSVGREIDAAHSKHWLARLALALATVLPLVTFVAVLYIMFLGDVAQLRQMRVERWLYRVFLAAQFAGPVAMALALWSLRLRPNRVAYYALLIGFLDLCVLLAFFAR